jgi:penicillin V acylase-like amidase (Ntn superfamily)
MIGTPSKLLGYGLALALGASSIHSAHACTRVLYVGDDGLVIAGRSMDWNDDIHTNLWVFPRGMERDGAAGPNSVKWTSKYGSLISSAYEAGTADGINEKGLVANLLYLSDADFGKADGKPMLSISAWPQYVLDNFATVAEAVDALRLEPFRLGAPTLPNGDGGVVHLAISDPTGDSAIFEYLAGKLVIHHGRQYVVMTNEPPFDQQLALNAYWQEVGGATFLPGTIRPADRFVRAYYLITSIPKSAASSIIAAVPEGSYRNQAVASVASVLRAVSVPFGMSSPSEPNVASTLWRAWADQTNLVYFFDSATSPNTFWVPLADLDFGEGAEVKKLTLTGGKVYSGNAADKFEPAKPFAFLPYAS